MVNDSLVEPVESFIKAVTGLGTGRLYIPLATSELLELHAFYNLRYSQSSWEVLFVRENKQVRILESLIAEHVEQVFFALVHSILIS